MLAVAMSTAVAQAKPHPTPSPTATPIADPQITDIARKQFVAWQAGKINKSLYSSDIQSQLTDEKIEASSRALGSLGALTGETYIGPLAVPDTLPNSRGYIYQMNCVGGSVYLFLIVEGQDKIDRIFFKDRLDVETVSPPPSAPPQSSPPA